MSEFDRGPANLRAIALFAPSAATSTRPRQLSPSRERTTQQPPSSFACAALTRPSKTRARALRARAHVGVERAARVDGEGLCELQTYALARGRDHLDFGDCAPAGF